MDANTKATAHSTADIGRIAREQWWFLGRSRRREVIGMGVLAALLVTGWVYVLVRYGAEVRQTAEVHPLMVIPVILLVALLWPASVWHREGPGERRYHGAMPIDRRVHDLLRIGAGAAWYYALLAGLVLISGLIELVAGYNSVILGSSPWLWAGLVVSPLILYMIGSVFAVLVERPILWMIGLFLVYQVTTGLIQFRFGADSLLYILLTAPFHAEYGLGNAISLAIGQEVYGESAGPLFRTWLPAAGLWLAITGAAMLAAVQRHPSVTLANPVARAWAAWRGVES